MDYKGQETPDLVRIQAVPDSYFRRIKARICEFFFVFLSISIFAKCSDFIYMIIRYLWTYIHTMLPLDMCSE